MEYQEILDFVEDKYIESKETWFLHSTRNDLETIKKILNEGITCAYLRNKNGNHFNGKYYISLYREDSSDWLKINHIARPKFIVDGIKPHYAVRYDIDKINFRKPFINTRIPLRTSEWDDEYQQYLKIDPSHFVALEYSLNYLLYNTNKNEIDTLKFIRDLISYLKEKNISLPVYDLSSKKEINKDKILSLNMGGKI